MLFAVTGKSVHLFQFYPIAENYRDGFNLNGMTILFFL